MAVTESKGVAKLLVKIDEAMSGGKFYEGGTIRIPILQ